MRTIRKIIIHCSDSPDDRDIGFQEIDDWHKARGFKSPDGVHCGYHYIIKRDGVVECGRTLNEFGAHAKGHNADSVGICVVGKKDFAEAQFITLRRLIKGLIEMYPDSTVHAHNEFNKGKTCPNFDVHEKLF